MPPYNAMQNTAEELDVLKGATILNVWAAEWDDGFESVPEGVIRIRVAYRKGLRVNDHPCGEYELWQDPEGNGPGFLSFVQEG